MSWRSRLRERGCTWDCGAASAVSLAAALLRVAAAAKDETRVDHGNPELSLAQNELLESVDAVLERASGNGYQEDLAAITLDEICLVLEVAALRPGFTALVAARVVDARFGQTFVSAFRARDGERIQPGDPIPVVPFPCERLDLAEQKGVLEALGNRTGDPRTRTDSVDRTDHLRLAPAEVKNLCVRYKWAPWLEPIRASTRFGFGVTNASRLEEDFRWEEYLVGSRPSFYGVVPKDPTEQQRRLTCILEQAVRANVSIAVLPELCLTPSILQSLLDRDLLVELPMVVAGSYHETPHARGPGRNVCKIFCYGDEVFTHYKFSDYHFDPKDGRPRCHEHLHREDGASGFELLLSPNCSAIALICKDVLRDDVQDLVEKLAPTLLLVPAMSNETSDFKSLAERFARNPQTFTAIACAGSGQHVIYGRPNRDHPVISSAHAPGSLVLSTISI
jgi:hypothetical protein